MAILTVTTTADNGTGSLREALQLAQSGDIIQFDSSLANSQITLTSGQLEIWYKDLTIDGTNAPNLTLSGNNQSRVLWMEGVGNSLAVKNLTIADGKITGTEKDGSGGGLRMGQQSHLTLENVVFQNNSATGYGGGALFNNYRSTAVIKNSKFEGNDASQANSEHGGGAILMWSEGDLTIENSEFSNNRGASGGAINNLLSNLTIDNSRFINNDSTAGASGAGGYGGAIYTDGASANYLADSGTIAIRNSHFEGNKGAGQGGALFLYVYGEDRVVVEDSQIINNEVVKNSVGHAYGGGIRQGNGQFSLRNTTIANNRAHSQGGGLWIGEQAPSEIVNSTFSGNTAADDTNQEGLGGAITFNNTDTSASSIVNTTIAYNHAAGHGGAVWAGNQPITTTNSIYAYNSAGNPWDIRQHTGRELIDGGNNIQYPPKNPSNPDDANITANVTLVDPQLGALQELNGALVHPLLAGSPAIDAGSSVTGLTADQLGVARSDGQIDIGSFEFVGPTITPDNSDSLSGTFGDDSLFGGSADQRIIAHKGNDYIDGGEGNDLIYGHADNDTLFGSGGSDSLYGGWHEDMLFGGSGNDLVYADQGNDIIEGNDGDDELFGQPGDDRLTGGTGNDNLYGGLGNDVLNGVDPNAAAPGANEQDLLSGGGNSDTFVLGDATRVYYDDRDPSTDGSADLATIADFNKLEDRIQLHGSAASYQLAEVTTGTGIYYTSGQTSPELVAVVRDVASSELNLNDSYFTYV
ncbi:MAG: hemolysin [Cyanobacteria bacterium J007]|nr:MAG: hemolysin [Cyanobacteria bacterium J007]